MKIDVHSEYENGGIYYNHSTKSEQLNNDYFSHYHDVNELIFIKSGEVSYEVGGKTYELHENMLVFARANESHSIHIDGASAYERYNILFDERKISSDIFNKIPCELKVINFDANKNVVEIFDKMDFYCEKLVGDELGLILFHLIEEVLLNIVIETSQVSEQTHDGEHPIIKRALSYIEENLLTISGIEEICNELYISKSHLHHLFMEHLNKSPKKYLNEKRLALAHREIIFGGKASEVCIKCGFVDYSSFYRAYKKHFGYSPTDTPRSDCVRISFTDYLRGYED